MAPYSTRKQLHPKQLDNTPSAVGKAKSTLDTIGRGLAQAAGPVAGDDVAANLAPVNLTQLGEEITNLAASIAPAMNAAMSSHPRTIKELLNVEQRPDEQNEIAFEQDTELHRRQTATPRTHSRTHPGS
ncbi:flavoprotein [Rhodococcus marinonascens]|uniref:flavoprotein n=1 Tax=Rhodococcus marinonascens TaxID=38311 RepID=UPI000ACEBABF|nr:flavoprotein [Rhodococcus marinonascens]